MIYPIIRGKGYFNIEDTPVLDFLGVLEIGFIERDEKGIESLLKEIDLQGRDVLEVYDEACQVMAKEVEFVIANTMYGAFAVLADNQYESSALCFKSIWKMCADKLEDDLILMVPTKETLLFAPKSNPSVVEQMVDHGKRAIASGMEKISEVLFIYLKEEGEIRVYE
ncbi:uncharacterized protein YtpQ (UPF0354 family) [Aequitasia blattaphilus]|uniref:Uncharacterized protein n=1 Tax=Aequitasia blattaphilus TaxID=2949332 RepID=A0ABT1EBT3_9FIRM|nr:hypothetical protein [Aequitasia blattaphilus]MCP1103272.1 hypothetical protein [Aequitasia blattaphilus]MCR8615912.1 hypothetical protein [Aequitasia blattaphilus]